MESKFVELIKRVLGVVWVALGLFIAYTGIETSIVKITSGNSSDIIFGWIILLILTPLIVGSLFLFGWLSVTGEYAKD